MRKIGLLILIAGSLLVFTAYNRPADKYFEIVKNLDIFATLFKEVNSYYVDDINPNKMMKTGIDAMLTSLDPYTNYIPEDDIEDYRTMTTGQYGGIGALIGKRKDRNAVLMVYEGFPAQKSGLKIGDEIIAIDGIDVTKKSSTEVSKLLKGQAGTQVKLKVQRYGEKEARTIEVQRDKIKLESVPYYGMVTNEIGYLHLTDFTSDAGRDVRKAIESLKEQGAKSLIFDLRDNPGGLLNEAVNVSNLFVPQNKIIVSTKGKVSEWNKDYRALNAPLDLEIPLVVLISGKSASASEIVSGVIQDYDRGVLVGQKSFGKGLVQATRPLTYNSQLKITTAKYYIPSGRCIQSIDYSKKAEDGSGTRIADSLKATFKTANGRTVYDGGGIMPDVEVVRPVLAPITQSLISKGLLFDYATVYQNRHASIAPAKVFKLSDNDFKDFVQWLSDKDYDYTTKAETEIKELEAAAKKEKYYDDIKDQIEQLSKKLMHNKEQDLQKNKAEIVELLEQEIVGRYYLEKGIKEASFDNDPEISTAVRILSNPAEYSSLLKGRK
jgi:carboxyl-terminal processing protease